MKSVAVITGGTSGIGKSLAIKYSKGGYKVYTLSRKNYKWKNKNITHIICNVTDENNVKNAVLNISKKENSISVLICCAGYGIAGVTEYTSLVDAKKQIDVNFFGTFLTIKTFLPLLKRNKGGKILFISSVASEIAIPFQSFYCASKAACNKLLEAWQIELRPYGIQICSVLLGDAKTEFTSNRQKSTKDLKQYKEAFNRSIEKMENDEQNGLLPDYIAKKIYSRSQKNTLPPIMTVGFSYHIFLLLQRLLPRKTILYIIKKLYG